MTQHVRACIALLACAAALAASQDTGKQLETLNRGAIAIPAVGATGMLVSWRLLATDPSGVGFNVYTGSRRLNPTLITTSTNFLDAAGTTRTRYAIRAVVNGVEGDAVTARVFPDAYLSIGLDKPAGGRTPDGVAYTYEANDGAVADLDGDGEYEIVVKWWPNNAKDNSQAGYTAPTLVDAYKLDGRKLWRVDLGRNIRSGSHYVQMVLYDLDGDGKAELMLKTADGTAELMLKTADGTVDGAGKAIGDARADHRNSKGYILKGPEFLTVFNGLTGAAMATVDYYPPRGDVRAWGDAYGNRVDRFLAGVAYVDGKRPSAIFARGYYTRAVIVAWDWRDGRLTRRWVHDSPTRGKGVYGQGAHWFSVADVNGDGKHDIIYGAGAVDSSGAALYSTGLGHGDALHVGDLDPSRAGLEVFMVHEEKSAKYGMEMHDAATGKILWGVGGGFDVGRGLCADVDPSRPGDECWSFVGQLTAANGQAICPRSMTINFAVWWDGDLQRELLDRTMIDKWVPAQKGTARLLTAYTYGADSNSGSKATPVISADILGDWREEVVWRSSDNSKLMLFATGIPTKYRLTTLMHDTQYRVQVAGQNMAYNQPPHPSFFLPSRVGAQSGGDANATASDLDIDTTYQRLPQDTSAASSALPVAAVAAALAVLSLL
eukprot:m51a1_g10635 putative rhamnogalacturonate lyase (660) ;mRNA; r:72861-74959